MNDDTLKRLRTTKILATRDRMAADSERLRMRLQRARTVAA